MLQYLRVNRLFLILVISGVTGSCLVAGEGRDLDLSRVHLTLYSSASRLGVDDRLSLIIEVENGGDSPVPCSGDIEIIRYVEGPSGNRMKPVAIKAKHRPDTLYVDVTCRVPERSEKRFIPPRLAGNSKRRLDVNAHDSLFLKVIIPREALEDGVCKISATGADGTIQSNVIAITRGTDVLPPAK